MKYRYMGNTGLLVSRVCLGTMTFGNKDWGCDEKTSIKLAQIFIEEGGNFIDTADLYSAGESEIITGKAIKDFRRDDIVLATKCWFRTAKTPTAKGLSRKHTMEACEASLKRLGTDFIDLYQIHGPDPHTPFEETMRTLDDLVRQGKVRYIGCSNLYAWQVLKANGISSCMNLEKLCCGQYLYNLIVRDVEKEILPACADQGMGFICWSPIGAGMLAGKYKKADRPDVGTRFDYNAKHALPRYWHERGFRIVEELVKVAENENKSPSQVALAWLLHDRRVTSVIVGSRRVEQMRENLIAGEWDLPHELWTKLDKIAEFDHGYPKQWMGPAFKETFGEEEF
jgi:aryl-alcohol dehydrogenase-like predicted oxidoreductase